VSIHLSVVMPVYNERYLVAECIRRVLAVESPLISKLDLIVVDDGSTDGTSDIIKRLASKHPDRITCLEHGRNLGKGAAATTGIAHARGWVTVIQDADLEYTPRDLDRLMLPFVREGADAVYGSRFLTHEYRRVLYFRHTIANRMLTLLCNVLTDLNLTDMETCYKAVRTRLLQSIPIRSRDFRFEPELTLKLAKRAARIFEVPVSYSGRTYQEGKKILPRDGLLALAAMLHYWMIDDVYQEDEYGSAILTALAGVRSFNRWMASTIQPYVGSSVLEIGAGIGNLTQILTPRDRYVASDINPHYLDYLESYAVGKPWLRVANVDLTNPDDFYDLQGAFDTVICLNVLEHVPDERSALESMRSSLQEDGRLVLLVPQGPRLFGSLDEALGHQRRYTRESLRAALEAGGFHVERLLDFNRATTPAWWFNARVLRRRHFGRVQMKAVNHTTWLLRRLDSLLPWPGASLIAVARRRL
jgi:glycosyltransferase involved in cell wall biosynthesis